MPKKKSLSRVKNKTPKKTKVKKKIKPIKKKVLKKIEEKELIIKTKPEWVKSALVNKAKYQKKYSDSIKKNDDFWKTEGKRITWIKPYKKIKNVKYSKKEVKKTESLSHLSLIRQSRLSVMPIDSKSWKILNKMSSI